MANSKTENIAWLRELLDEKDREFAVATLGKAFLRASPSERQMVAEGWDFGNDWPYPSPERLACVRGERFSPRDRIVASLVLDFLEGACGPREHLIALSATSRSCELAALSPEAVFETVAAALPVDEAEDLRAFCRRPVEDRHPRAFDLHESRNLDGEVEIVFDPPTS